MKVLFVQDNIINESIPLMELAALLKKDGHIPKVLIEDEEKKFNVEVLKFSPDIFIIPCPILAWKWAKNMARRLKGIISRKTVLVGIYPTLFPQTIEDDFIDMLCVGEAEFAVLELLRKIEKKEDFRSSSNLIYKEGSKVIVNKLMALVEDLDLLPMPDRSLYYERYKIMADLGFKKFISSRGCIYNCAYCFNASLKKIYHEKAGQIRKKTPQRVIEEIVFVREHYFLSGVHFSDDLFPINKPWVMEFAGLYNNNVKLPFTFNARADVIDAEMLRALCDCGCRGIAVGVESGNEALRGKIMNKLISNEKIIKTCRMIKDMGLKLATFNMVGSPHETIDNILESIQLNRTLRADSVRVTIPVLIPNTDFFSFAVDNGFLSKDCRELKSFVFKKSGLEKREALNMYYLFSFLVKVSLPARFVKFLIKLPAAGAFLLLKLFLFFLCERKFFLIGFLDGARYMWHVKNINNRKKFYPSYL